MWYNKGFFTAFSLPSRSKSNKYNINIKKDRSKKVTGFRPISSCNISYKFISKLVADRLCLVLRKFIAALQYAFIQNRDIHDNILIASEILSTFSKHRKIKGNMAIKLVMEKVYDRLIGNFLRNILLI